MQGKRTGGGSTAGLRWLVHLTSVTAAGALLGAAAAQQLGDPLALGALIGGLGLGTLAILRRWLARPPSPGDDRARRPRGQG